MRGEEAATIGEGVPGRLERGESRETGEEGGGGGGWRGWVLGDWGMIVGERGRVVVRVTSFERGIGEEVVSEKEEKEAMGAEGKEVEGVEEEGEEKEELEIPAMVGRGNFPTLFFLGEVILSIKGKEGEVGNPMVGWLVEGEGGGEERGEEEGDPKEGEEELWWARPDSKESRRSSASRESCSGGVGWFSFSKNILGCRGEMAEERFVMSEAF